MFRTGRVQHGADVVHALLEGRERRVGSPIGQTRASLVEEDSRENDARRVRKRAYDGSSQFIPTLETQPGT